MVALGLTLIYGVLNQINFAHADFVTAGAFAAFFTATRFATKVLGLPDTGGYLLSIVAALGAGALLGLAVNAAVDTLGHLLALRVTSADKQDSPNDSTSENRCDNGDQPLSELTTFPQHPSMAVGYDAWKRAEEKRRLAEESDATENALEPEEIEGASAPEEKISDAPPPKAVHPALTGRLRQWKGNGK
jgi:hypothetical protein